MVEGLLQRASPSAAAAILYTGAPVVRGVDPLRRSLEAILMQAADDAGDGSLVARYDEIDPDVFGGLAHDAYAEVTSHRRRVAGRRPRARSAGAAQPALPGSGRRR
ncbi:MAG: hypothetical protein U1F43_13410 [Myxococcota bacterium]